MSVPRATLPTPAPDGRRSLLVWGLLGIGLMAAVDEIVFHQILAWHHFYDRSTGEVALLSDGLLHAGELIVIVASAATAEHHTLAAGRHPLAW